MVFVWGFVFDVFVVCCVYLLGEQRSDKENHLVGLLGITKPCGFDEIEALGTVGNPVNFHRKKKT